MVEGVPPQLETLTFEEETEAEKKLVRKIDMFLLPMIWVVYLLSYMVSSKSSCSNTADSLGPLQCWKRSSRRHGRRSGTHR